MERVPDAFAKQLEREFDGRYRLRWSLRKGEWHLEQRVGVGAADPPFRDDPEDDSLVRAKDGYAFVMAIRTGDRMPCPSGCGATLRVPLRETSEVACARCRLAGRDGRVAAAFYPLDDSLVQHIRHIDAYLGHREDLKHMMDARNQAHMAAASRETLNEIDAVSLDVRKTFGGIEQVGYGGSIIRPVA